MILILPFLLIILHFSQIGLTDDLTFTVKSSFQKSSFDIIAQCYAIMQVDVLYFFKYNATKMYSYDTSQLFYLSLQMILPLDKSYGDNSIVTLSPGKILM